MKIQIEGSNSDIRGLFNDTVAAKDAAVNQLRNEALEKDLLAANCKLEEAAKEVGSLRTTLMVSAQKFNELRDGTGSLRMELDAKTAHIASQDAEIQRLKFLMNDPIKLSAAQEAEIEELYQKMVIQYQIKPLVCASPEAGKSISAEYIVTSILDCLAAGNKVGACREIRAATGMPLVKTRDIVHRALLAFGCHVNDKGSPTTVVGAKVPPAVDTQA